jgi:hypothetical protein
LGIPLRLGSRHTYFYYLNKSAIIEHNTNLGHFILLQGTRILSKSEDAWTRSGNNGDWVPSEQLEHGTWLLPVQVTEASQTQPKGIQAGCYEGQIMTWLFSAQLP